jgi:hypothetical protein
MPVCGRSASVWLTRAKTCGGQSRAHAALNALSAAFSEPLGNVGLLSVIGSSCFQDVRCPGLDVSTHLLHTSNWVDGHFGRAVVHIRGYESWVYRTGLRFANGGALGPEDAFPLVNDTVAARVHYLRLAGPPAGTAGVILDGLPGYPGNLSYHGRGLFRVALAKLSPEAEVSDQERALYSLVHLAVSGDAEGTTLDQFVSEREWPLDEHAMAELEAVL